ncbi:MAG: nicotinate phosphoribosyltransferase [bacterium]
MELDKTSDIQQIRIEESRKFFSATHDEIESGATTDIYFLRTRDILKKQGLLNTRVVADVFCRRGGFFCGSEEVRRLLAGRKIEMLALPDGERYEAGATVMQFSGPYGEFGLYETVLLGMTASATGWATAAAECVEAAAGSSVVCFGSRHIHPSVAPVMERAAMIGGVDGCSCILGALLAGVRPTGTIPHAAIMISGDTVKVARVFDEIMEEEVPRIILVDTFKDEAEESLRVAEALREHLAAVRLDTPSERGGVTPQLVAEVRKRLDVAGFNYVRIVVSGGLTPERIRILKTAGADFFGVGSYISSAPPIEMTMDIKEIEGKAVAKRGRLPGPAPSPRLVKMI